MQQCAAQQRHQPKHTRPLPQPCLEIWEKEQVADDALESTRWKCLQANPLHRDSPRWAHVHAACAMHSVGPTVWSAVCRVCAHTHTHIHVWDSSPLFGGLACFLDFLMLRPLCPSANRHPPILYGSSEFRLQDGSTFRRVQGLQFRV